MIAEVDLCCLRGLAETLFVRSNRDEHGPFSSLSDDERDAWLERAIGAAMRVREADAWERGHRGCGCDRPGATPCPNPFKGVGQ